MTLASPKKTKAARATTSAPAHYTLDRLDQVRLLAHPLRLRLFEAFAIEPRTTQQVARALGLAPTRLYHHVNALEKVGLLRLQSTRQVRGATEKYYQAVGRMLEVEPGLFAGKPKGRRGGMAAGAVAGSRESIEAVVAQLMESARADLGSALVRYSETPESLRPIAAQVVVHGTPEKLAELRRRVVALIAERSTPATKKKAGASPMGGRATLTLIFTAGLPVRSNPE